MPSLFDPRLDLLMGGVDLETLADLTQFLQCLPPPLGGFGAQPILGAHQPGDRPAVAGNDDLAAFLDLVDQTGQMCLGVENPYMFHRLADLTS